MAEILNKGFVLISNWSDGNIRCWSRWQKV